MLAVLAVRVVVLMGRPYGFGILSVKHSGCPLFGYGSHRADGPADNGDADDPVGTPPRMETLMTAATPSLVNLDNLASVDGQAISKATWAHLHLPRLRAGVADVISVKVPGRRIGYVETLVLHNAQFKVSEPGRQRCLAENVRNVHAWVVGDAGGPVPDGYVETFPGGLRKAVYDPWKGGTFVDSQTLLPVLTADLAVMVGKDVFYAPTPQTALAQMAA